jgi:hypothetical protein
MKLVIQGLEVDLNLRTEATQQGLLLRNLPAKPVSAEVTLTITGASTWNLLISEDVIGGSDVVFRRSPNASRRLFPIASRRMFP